MSLELTIKQRMTQPAAPGNKAYQKFKPCNLTPSMNRMGKLAAINSHAYHISTRLCGTEACVIAKSDKAMNGFNLVDVKHEHRS